MSLRYYTYDVNCLRLLRVTISHCLDLDLSLDLVKSIGARMEKSKSN